MSRVSIHRDATGGRHGLAEWRAARESDGCGSGERMKWVRVMKVCDGGTAEGCGVWWCRLVGGKKGVTSFKRKRSINKCVSYVMAWQRLLLVHR